MKILVVTQYFYPHTGGSQEYILELYKEVIRQNPSTRVDVLCYNTDKAASEETLGGVHIHRVPSVQILPGQFALANPFAIWNVVRKLKQTHGNYDIVNSHTRFFDNSWWAPLVAQFLGAKSVLTDHCASHPVTSTRILSSIIGVFDSLLAIVVPKFYDHVTAISKATAQFIKSNGYSKKISVFYSGINSEFTKKQASKLPFKMVKNQILVSFVGRMIASKNPELVLKVAQQITKDLPNVVFAFAGDGPEFKRLSTSSTKQIHFLGKLNRQQTATLLQKTDILLHPSVHHEGLPITLLEAGASKTAIIASNAGASTEVIINDKTGIIANTTVAAFVSATRKFISDKNLRNSCAKNVQEFVLSHFSWKRTARDFYTLLVS